MTHVLDLPDDALLAVLAYLPPRQLFACRVACKRLRDLCLHRFLWRHVTLKYWCNAGLVRAVLVLAPCIKSLECSGGTAAQASRLRTIICVVTELSLYVSGRGEMTLAMAIIRRPPGLRKLHLYLSKFQWSIKPLLQVVHCLDVETLSLDMHAADVLMPAAWCELEVKPSLRELTYYSKTGDSFLLLLLRTHAATLEDVRLHIKNDFPVSALLRIPGLRSIECSPTADLHPLVALPHLHTVVFRRVAFHGAQDYHPGALQFLREALHVRTLNLRFCRHAALMALADSRSAPLIETLSVSQSNWPLLKILPLILPKLTALKVLELSAKPTDAFLQTICPSSAPSLTTMAVVYRGTCLHAWVRSGVVQDLLSMNPCLHLCVAKWNNCSLCLKDFHGELSQPGCPSSFSSHSKTTGCPRDCFKVTA